VSEKMTDRQIGALESHNEDDGVDAEQVAALIAEVRRARRVEQEQAETIKALADALWHNAPHWFSEVDGARTFHSKDVTAALRLAGRTP
jgi:hypothetical protein